MEKINTKEKLIDALKDILAVEKIARAGYVNDIGNFSHPKLISPISRIKADEDRHIEILVGLIRMLEKGED